MINSAPKRAGFGIGALIGLILFGLVFAVVGYLPFGLFGKVDPDWTKTTGTVVSTQTKQGDDGTLHAAVVQYEVNGQNYTVTSNISSSSAPKIGSTREVAYDPAQPEASQVVEDWKAMWFIFLFPLIGLICIILAPILFINSLRRAAAISRLLQSGTKITGVVTGIREVGKVNDRPIYKIAVSATDPTGQVKEYLSDALNNLGGLFAMDLRSAPVPVDVYLDPANPKLYYVDISDIPNLTPERLTELLKGVGPTNTPQA